MAFLQNSDFILWSGKLFTNTDWDSNWKGLVGYLNSGNYSMAFSRVGIGTTTITAGLNVAVSDTAKGINVDQSMATGSPIGISVTTNGIGADNNYGVTSYVSGATDFNVGIASQVTGTATQNIGLFGQALGTSGLNFGVYVESLGSTTAFDYGVYVASSGIGVFANSNSQGNGYSSIGLGTGSTSSHNSDSYGVQINSVQTVSGTGKAYGVYSLVNNVNTSNSNDIYALYTGGATSGSGNNYALYCSASDSYVKLPYVTSVPTATVVDGTIKAVFVSSVCYLYMYMSGGWKRAVFS